MIVNSMISKLIKICNALLQKLTIFIFYCSHELMDISEKCLILRIEKLKVGCDKNHKCANAKAKAGRLAAVRGRKY